MLFTTDEFSDEDLFRTDNPYRLGYNLAAATISDVLAVGGTPYAYSHAVKASSSWTSEYVTQLAQGIGAVLKTCGIGSIGGDIGSVEPMELHRNLPGLFTKSDLQKRRDRKTTTFI